MAKTRGRSVRRRDHLSALEGLVGLADKGPLYLLLELKLTHLQEFRNRLEDLLRISGAIFRERVNIERRDARWAANDAAAAANGRPCDPVR
jgi:hypothetical protein